MVIPGNLVGARYGFDGQVAALVSIECVALGMAIWGIFGDHLYSGRLIFTKHKAWIAAVTGVMVPLVVLIILHAVEPLAVQQALSPLMRSPHIVATIVTANAIPVLLVPVAEELLFHGYLFEYASKRFHGRIRVVASTVVIGSLFGFGHTVHDYEQMLLQHTVLTNELKLFAFQYVWGILGCFIYAYSENLLYLIVIHGWVNSSLGLPLVLHPNYLGLLVLLAFIPLPLVRYISRTGISHPRQLDKTVTRLTLLAAR